MHRKWDSLSDQNVEALACKQISIMFISKCKKCEWVFSYHSCMISIVLNGNVRCYSEIHWILCVTLYVSTNNGNMASERNITKCIYKSIRSEGWD